MLVRGVFRVSVAAALAAGFPLEGWQVTGHGSRRVHLSRSWAGRRNAAGRCRAPVPIVMPDEGSLRADLLAAVRLMAQAIGQQDLALLTGVFAGMRTDPELADAMRCDLLGDKESAIAPLFQRAADPRRAPAHRRRPALPRGRTGRRHAPPDRHGGGCRRRLRHPCGGQQRAAARAHHTLDLLGSTRPERTQRMTTTYGEQTTPGSPPPSAVATTTGTSAETPSHTSR